MGAEITSARVIPVRYFDFVFAGDARQQEAPTDLEQRQKFLEIETSNVFPAGIRRRGLTRIG
jgi:hypothetical protein